MEFNNEKNLEKSECNNISKFVDNTNHKNGLLRSHVYGIYYKKIYNNIFEFVDNPKSKNERLDYYRI